MRRSFRVRHYASPRPPEVAVAYVFGSAMALQPRPAQSAARLVPRTGHRESEVTPEANPSGPVRSDRRRDRDFSATPLGDRRMRLESDWKIDPEGQLLLIKS